MNDLRRFNYQIIDTTKALSAALPALANADVYYLDTEFDATRRGTTFCLLQISTGKECFVIDMVRLTAIERLGEVIARPGVEWAFHHGTTDVRLLTEKLQIDEFPRIFDTRVAWGLLGPEVSISLAYLIYRVLGIRVRKEQQADDWKIRPLSGAQLEYAAQDVEHLPELRRVLRDRLIADGKEALVDEVFRESLRPADMTSGDGDISMDDFRGAWELDYDGQAALTFLIDWYNSLLPTERPAGLAKQTLFLIARRMPESRDELAAIKGVPRRWAQQYGDWLTGRLIRATSEANPSSYKLLEPAPYTTFGETIIRGWLEYARAMVSEQVSIAPEIAFPTWLMNRLLRACFQANTPEKLLGQIAGWRADWLAEPLQQMWHASWGG